MAIEIPASLSPTQLDAFSDCRLRWYWGYAKGYRPMQRSFHLDLGIGVHEALEHYYLEGIDPVTTFEKWFKREVRRTEALVDGAEDLGVANLIEADLDTLREAYDMGKFMLKDYTRYYKQERFEVIQGEQLSERAIPGTDWILRVKLDLLVRDLKRDKKVFVLDHKTFTNFSPDFLRKSHQFVAYTWVADTLVEEPISGVIYNGLRKPKSMNTKLGMFERHYLPVTDKQIKLFLRRARDMHFRLTQGTISVFPEPGEMKCKYCAFKDPCEAFMIGEDYQFLLDNLYVKREDEIQEHN